MAGCFFILLMGVPRSQEVACIDMESLLEGPVDLAGILLKHLKLLVRRLRNIDSLPPSKLLAAFQVFASFDWNLFGAFHVWCFVVSPLPFACWSSLSFIPQAGQLWHVLQHCDLLGQINIPISFNSYITFGYMPKLLIHIDTTLIFTLDHGLCSPLFLKVYPWVATEIPHHIH